MGRTLWLRRAALWLPPLAYMAVIFHVSSEPNPLPEVTAVVWDKALHASEYAGLALLLARAFSGERFSIVASLALAAFLASAYGASDEFHQSFTPERDSDVLDWTADTVGAGLGAATYGLSAIARPRSAAPRGRKE
jgi:VanZ family protein